jgi:hypothetical protein
VLSTFTAATLTTTSGAWRGSALAAAVISDADGFDEVPRRRPGGRRRGDDAGAVYSVEGPISGIRRAQHGSKLTDFVRCASGSALAGWSRHQQRLDSTTSSTAPGRRRRFRRGASSLRTDHGERVDSRPPPT